MAGKSHLKLVAVIVVVILIIIVTISFIAYFIGPHSPTVSTTEPANISEYMIPGAKIVNQDFKYGGNNASLYVQMNGPGLVVSGYIFSIQVALFVVSNSSFEMLISATLNWLEINSTNLSFTYTSSYERNSTELIYNFNSLYQNESSTGMQFMKISVTVDTYQEIGPYQFEQHSSEVKL